MTPIALAEASPLRPNIRTQVGMHHLGPALHVRRHTLQSLHSGASGVAVLLTAGSGGMVHQGVRQELQAPALVWLPLLPEDDLRVAAGSNAELLFVSDMLIRDAIGHHAESLHLRFLRDRFVVVNEIVSTVALHETSHSFAAIARELRRDERGSWNFLAAHLALIMVQVWRLSGIEDVMRQDGGTHSSHLLRFRHLVEMHFHERWRIGDYARALGLSHDRLHDLCVRRLQRTPLALVHERILHEARLRLARSGTSVEALAEDLGFRNATHFCHFFRKRSGLSALRYRQEARRTLQENETLPTPGYADWP